MPKITNYRAWTNILNRIRSRLWKRPRFLSSEVLAVKVKFEKRVFQANSVVISAFSQRSTSYSSALHHKRPMYFHFKCKESTFPVEKWLNSLARVEALDYLFSACWRQGKLSSFEMSLLLAIAGGHLHELAALTQQAIFQLTGLSSKSPGSGTQLCDAWKWISQLQAWLKWFRDWLNVLSNVHIPLPAPRESVHIL